MSDARGIAARVAELRVKLREEERESEAGRPCHCAACAEPYSLDFGTEPTGFCHPCAQALFVELLEGFESLEDELAAAKEKAVEREQHLSQALETVGKERARIAAMREALLPEQWCPECRRHVWVGEHAADCSIAIAIAIADSVPVGGGAQ